MGKRILTSARAALGMFSRIPVGRVAWEGDEAAYLLCFFPLAGLLAGAVNFGLSWLGEYLLFGDVFMGVILTLAPVFLTGGIHLDGFMDVSDALSSWGEKEKRLQILKDSHVGAFAVIRVLCLLLLQAAAYSDMWMEEGAMLVMGACFVISRILSALGVLYLPKANPEGSLAGLARQSREKVTVPVLLGLLALCAMGLTFFSPVLGGGALLTCFLSFAWYRHIALHFFGGTTGDVGGYFVCVCETACALVLAVLCRIL